MAAPNKHGNTIIRDLSFPKFNNSPPSLLGLILLHSLEGVETWAFRLGSEAKYKFLETEPGTVSNELAFQMP